MRGSLYKYHYSFNIHAIIHFYKYIYNSNNQSPLDHPLISAVQSLTRVTILSTFYLSKP